MMGDMAVMTVAQQTTSPSSTPPPESPKRPASPPRAVGQVRRTELGTFLRSRRERLLPEDVGLPPSLRRRTPGLRREEVAQLAGVGVTWYTWLEQGRPINASTQVLDSIARTLKLDPDEHSHLYRLADVPSLAPAGESSETLGPDVQTVLDELNLIACVINERFDLLAWNHSYEMLFPAVASQVGKYHNIVWNMFTSPGRCHVFVNREEEMPRIVATLVPATRTTSASRTGSTHQGPDREQLEVRAAVGAARGGQLRHPREDLRAPGDRPPAIQVDEMGIQRTRRAHDRLHDGRPADLRSDPDHAEHAGGLRRDGAALRSPLPAPWP